MTVAELIEKLKDMPQDTHVISPSGWPITDVYTDTVFPGWADSAIKVVKVG